MGEETTDADGSASVENGGAESPSVASPFSALLVDNPPDVVDHEWMRIGALLEQDGVAEMDTAPRGPWIEVTNDGKTWRRVRFYQTRMRLPVTTNGRTRPAWVAATCWSTSHPSKFANRVENPIAWRQCDQSWDPTNAVFVAQGVV